MENRRRIGWFCRFVDRNEKTPLDGSASGGERARNGADGETSRRYLPVLAILSAAVGVSGESGEVGDGGKKPSRARRGGVDFK